MTTFDFNESPVRIELIEGHPWFVLADLCRVLELTNPSMVCDSLDEDEKGLSITDTLGGRQKMLTVSESGLYALVFKSRKPEAKTFRKWVTAEVLPALRQTGKYEVPVNEEPQTPFVLPRERTVRDQVMSLRELLLNSAAAVQLKMLDTGRAQQVANLSARFLETIKMEGDAIGYETLFEMRAGEGGGGLLQAEAGRPANAVQGVPQRGMQGTKGARSRLPAEAVSGEEALGTTEPEAGADAPGQDSFHGGSPAAAEGGGGCAPTTEGSAEGTIRTGEVP